MIVILVGMPGSGKTTLAENLASILNYDFIDLDNSITSYLNKTIPQIFNDHGEEYFRKYESMLLKETLTNKINQNIILSLGGGAFLSSKNRILCKNWLTIWLNTNVDIIYNRIKDQTHRPLLLEKNLKKKLTNLFEERKNYYNKANIIYNVNSEMEPSMVARNIADIIQLSKK